MTQFVSALEAATYLNGTTDLADLTAEWVAQANALLTAISDDVEAAAGIPIEGTSTTLVLAGTWSRDLELPEGPIRNVTAVTVDGILQPAGTYWWNDRQLLRRGANPTNADEDDNDYPRTIQGAQARAGYYWSSPAATVLVDLDQGFDDVPGFVASLVLRIFARTIGNVSNVTQESLAVYSVTYGQSRSDQGSHLSELERRRLRQLLRTRGGTIAPAAL